MTDLPMERVPADALDQARASALRALFDAAWPDGDFDATDWEHATSPGGVHVISEIDGVVVAHASVVPRALELAGRPVNVGYVEAVATHPAHGGRGLGSAVMREIGFLIAERHELGALSTGIHAFYERLGWRRWRGPTFIRTADGVIRSEEDDDGVMVLPTPALPEPDLDAPISIEWRPGDTW